MPPTELDDLADRQQENNVRHTLFCGLPIRLSATDTIFNMFVHYSLSYINQSVFKDRIKLVYLVSFW